MAAKPHLGTWEQVRAGLLLEAELRRKSGGEIPSGRWPPAVKSFRCLPVLTRLAYVQSWLRSVEDHQEDVLPVCEALISHIASFREERLDAYEDRRDFITEARKAWSQVQRLGVSRIQRVRERGNEAAAQELEAQLLHWAEQFDNRLLLEELRLKDQEKGSAGAREMAPDLLWIAGEWGFQEPWGRQEITSWTEEGIARWWRDRFRQYTLPGATIHPEPCCLDAIDVPEYDDVCTGDRTSLCIERAFDSWRDPETLIELVPPGSVWVRSLFEQDGALRWWAWMGEEETLTRLASGKSNPGARERLEEANREFDQAVDNIWRARRLSLDDFRGFNDALFDPLCFFHEHAPDEADRAEFFAAIASELCSLAQEYPRLARAGKELLRWLREFPGHPRPVPAGAWLIWSAAGERPRSVELDLLSEEHRASIEREWDLSSLWDQREKSIDWQATDVLFQVQGPLLAMPLAWLSFGGRPLFQRVASTSTAVSLTLRHFSQERAGKAVKPPPRLLSTQWERREKRAKNHGLPLLHAGLRCVARDHRWESWSIGDDPQASAGHVCAALQQRFGTVVIGGHGNAREAGVLLANETTWCGKGADLSDVDLLILVSCSVGRLAQEGSRDVEGMYASLAVHGARCVVAARWTIADLEAAVFIVEFVNEYLKNLQRKGKVETFDRARALNCARRKVLKNENLSVRVSFHNVAAFDMYGLG